VRLLARLDRWLLAAALLLSACLLRPSVAVQRALFDHVVVLDITQSMNVQDQLFEGQAVSRLAFAKQALRHALLQLPCGSKLGWAVFTEYRSYLLHAPIEVCAHLQELRATLAQIDGRMAWSGNSEVAKGLFSAIGVARQLEGKPSVVFISDGHEAPPLKPQRGPVFADKPGDVAGLVIGVGGLVPQPIPKRDLLGRPLGMWAADEVVQTERGGSAEHLSSLHEAHLRQLAADTGLAFVHLRQHEALAASLSTPTLARPVPARADLRPWLGGLALVLLLVRLRRG
jgi:mxaL protein